MFLIHCCLMAFMSAHLCKHMILMLSMDWHLSRAGFWCVCHAIQRFGLGNEGLWWTFRENSLHCHTHCTVFPTFTHIISLKLMILLIVDKLIVLNMKSRDGLNILVYSDLSEMLVLFDREVIIVILKVAAYVVKEFKGLFSFNQCASLRKFIFLDFIHSVIECRSKWFDHYIQTNYVKKYAIEFKCLKHAFVDLKIA